MSDGYSLLDADGYTVLDADGYERLGNDGDPCCCGCEPGAYLKFVWTWDCDTDAWAVSVTGECSPETCDDVTDQDCTATRYELIGENCAAITFTYLGSPLTKTLAEIAAEPNYWGLWKPADPATPTGPCCECIYVWTAEYDGGWNISDPPAAECGNVVTDLTNFGVWIEQPDLTWKLWEAGATCYGYDYECDSPPTMEPFPYVSCDCPSETAFVVHLKAGSIAYPGDPATTWGDQIVTVNKQVGGCSYSASIASSPAGATVTLGIISVGDHCEWRIQVGNPTAVAISYRRAGTAVGKYYPDGTTVE